MPINLTEVLKTRAGVLRFPNEAALAVIADPPATDISEEITIEVISTRAGVLRFPNEVAAYLATL